MDTAADDTVFPDAADPRRRRALASRAEVARAEELLTEAETVGALLVALGIGPAALGPLAEAQGVAPTALRASDAIRAVILSELRGSPQLPIREAVEERTPPPGFEEKLDEIFARAVAPGAESALSRAASRLKATLLGR